MDSMKDFVTKIYISYGATWFTFLDLQQLPHLSNWL
jgi:hypothetical protein